MNVPLHALFLNNVNFLCILIFNIWLQNRLKIILFYDKLNTFRITLYFNFINFLSVFMADYLKSKNKSNSHK